MPHDPAIRRLMWFFAIVYTVEGIGQAKVGVLWQPLTHFLKETQGWTTVQISVSLAVLDVPWMVKPLYGLVSDVLPLFGYRRRGYLVVANAAAVAAFVWVAGLTTPALIVPALVVTAIAMAVSSTICGALLVEAGQRHDASGAFVNQQWLWFNVAVTAMSLLGGLLTEHLSPAGALHGAAWIAAVAPLAILGSLTLIHEERVRLDRAALRQRLRGLMLSVRSRRLWLIAGFLFCYYFSPGLGTPLYFHLTDRLGFSQGFIGVLASVSACGWIAGGLLYRRVLARLAPRTLLALSILSGAGSTLLYLGLSGPASAVAVYFLSGVAGMIANIITLTIAAEHCPEWAEGFAFAALMSVMNLATPLSDMLGATLYEHVFGGRLGPLILVSAACTSLVLLALPWLEVRPPRPPR